jgi:acetyl-CoA carboxylase biotin carboxyl carrier protein
MANEASTPGDIFDVKKVRRLVELMKEHDLAEVDLRQGEQRIRIRRGAEPFVTSAPSAAASSAHGHAPAAAHSTASAAPSPAADDRGMQEIKSPMVGTFYTAANPESPPFVKVGDHVGPESVVCIIEAMKVFNEIPAEVSGQIAAVLVENNTPVEFGQPLFKVNVRQ